MRAKLLVLSIGVACSTAAVADAVPQAQPIAPGGAVAAAKAQARPLATVVASPVVMETTAERMPDGSIALNCAQKPNPHPAPIGVNRPAPEPQQ
jgi:hypothetical protein